MHGMNRQTGQQLSDIEHVRQSIVDICTTPIGSRVFRREYGSRLPDLIDNPITAGTLLDIYTASADAIAKWEPRFDLKTVKWAELQPDYGFVGLVLFGNISLDKKRLVENSLSSAYPVALDIALNPAPDSTTPTNPYLPTSRQSRVSYSPLASWNGTSSTITLPETPLEPIMLFANGVNYDVTAITGKQLTVNYDVTGDLLTVYYMTEGRA